jgi:serine/threonine-protein kinase
VLSATVPEALELVVQRAMAKDARDRYQTTGELDLALLPFDIATGEVISMVLSAPAPGKSQGTLVRPAAPGATSSPQGIEATALTMMAGIGGAAASAELATNQARSARPTIVVVGAGLGLWFVGGSVDALAGVVRYLHGVELTLTESMLLFFGILFIAATPAVMFVLRVKKVVWPNTVKSVELAADLRRTAAAALVTYGSLALLLRAVFTVLLRDSASVAEGLLDTCLFAASAIGAVVAGGLGPLARALRRKANR